MTDKTKPAPAEIDSLCIAFDAAKAAVETAQQNFSTAKGELTPVIQTFGYVPTHAPKTTRLEGQLYVADLTTPSTIEINEAQVAELRSELSRMKMPKVFNELFDRQIKHSLRKDAAGTLKLATGRLDEAKQTHLALLFSSCFSVGTKAPSLSVDLAEALKAKEAEKDAKAAAKAAKAAKKAKKGGAQ